MAENLEHSDKFQETLRQHPELTEEELKGSFVYQIGILIPILIDNLAGQYKLAHPDEAPFNSPGSLTLFATSLSVIIQVVVFITVGPYGRKRNLGISAAIAYISTMAFSMWWLAVVLLIIANVAYGVSFIYYNAYLPLMMFRHPDYLEAAKDPTQSGDEVDELYETLMNHWSSTGMGWGYAAGVGLMIVSIGIMVVSEVIRGSKNKVTTLTPAPTTTAPLTTTTTLFPQPDPKAVGAVTVAIFVCGAWWCLWTILSLRRLKSRPGPPAPVDTTCEKMTLGWTNVWKTILVIKNYPETLKFMAGYFFFMDGFNTIGSVGVQYGLLVFDMTSIELGILGLIVAISSMAGIYLFLYLHKEHGYTTKGIVLFCLGSVSVLGLYSLFGWIEGSPVGLVKKWEMYFFATIYGLFVGVIQSFSRVLFSELIPLGTEAEMFSLYEVVDKGSSWMGPLIVAAILEKTDDLRLCLLVIVFFLVIPMFPLYMVDVEEGKKQAGKSTTDELFRQGSVKSINPHSQSVDEIDSGLLPSSSIEMESHHVGQQ